MTDEYEMEYTREDELLERITELEEENAKLKAYNEKLLNGDIEKHNKIVEFEKKISVLLSCKNCPNNKGGYICQKEYEDKCLAQKIQYIKELKEEIAELEKELEQAKKVQVVEHFEAYGQCRDSRRIAGLEKENTEQKKKIENLQKYLDTRNCYRECAETWEKLTKAKKIISNLYAICKDNHYPNTSVLMEQAEQFLKKCE